MIQEKPNHDQRASNIIQKLNKSTVSFEAYQASQNFWVNQEVTNEKGDCGIITQINSYDDQLIQAVVKWENGLEIPEQLENLTPVVDAVEGLTEDESKHLLRLERKIEKSFHQAGKALEEIRDNNLYKHKGTFENYCKQRFGFSRAHPYRLINAAIAVDHIISFNVSHGRQKLPLPIAERQIRPATQFDPDTQVKIWAEAVKENLGKIPTQKIVKGVAAKFKEKIDLSDRISIGDVYQILPKDNEDLAGLTGCWGIVDGISKFSCQVKTCHGIHQAFIENLKDFNCTNADKQSYQQLLDRLSSLNFEELEETQKVVMKAIAKINRTVDSNGSLLTDFEEMVLQLIEED